MRVAALLVFAPLLAAMATAAASDAGANDRSQLAESPSAYLRQHADDPVDWRVLGEEAFSEAAAEGKLVFLSSGYFACHWCHVLQRETFLDPEFAERIGDDFVAIKMDRELSPAEDAFLIDFLRTARGIAGWPLNIVLTPEGDPLTGLVYAPMEEFTAFFEDIAARHRDDPERLAALARNAREELREQQLVAQQRAVPGAARVNWAQRWLRSWSQEADDLGGGLGEGAKFPRAPVLETALDLATNANTQREAELAAGPRTGIKLWVEETLDAMMRDGLRDALEGGFFRYSETPDWTTPHFEKMLDDQLRLVRVFAQAGDRFGEARFSRIAAETMAAILQGFRVQGEGPLRLASGLSAIDGDDVDGGYYLFTSDELDAALPPDSALASRLRAFWRVEGAPAFEAGHLLREREETRSWATLTAQRDGVDAEDLRRALDATRDRLLKLRAQRLRPRDDKALLGLHALWLERWMEPGVARQLLQRLGAAVFEETREATASLALDLLDRTQRALEDDTPLALLLDRADGGEADFGAAVRLAAALRTLLDDASALVDDLPAAPGSTDATAANAHDVAVPIRDAATDSRAGQASSPAGDRLGARLADSQARLRDEQMLVDLVVAIWRWYGDADGWNSTRDPLLPAMAPARFVAGVHDDSPSASWQALARHLMREPHSEIDVRALRPALREVESWPLPQAVRDDLLAHSDWLRRVWLEPQRN